MSITHYMTCCCKVVWHAQQKDQTSRDMHTVNRGQHAHPMASLEELTSATSTHGNLIAPGGHCTLQEGDRKDNRCITLHGVIGQEAQWGLQQPHPPGMHTTASGSTCPSCALFSLAP